MEAHSAVEHKCPGCGRNRAADAGSAEQSSPPPRCRRLYCMATLLLLIPALAPFWLGPLTHAFVGFHSATGSGWIIEEVGKRFIFAAVSIGSAIMGAYLFTTAVGLRVNRKAGL